MTRHERGDGAIELGSDSPEHDEPKRLESLLQAALLEAGLADNELIQKSIRLGLELHKDDERTYEPYVNHLLRVTTRLLEFGITDPELIAAGMLHDSLEDHPGEISEVLQNIHEIPHSIIEMGRLALETYTTPLTATLVEGVSNPIVKTGENKMEVYIAHIQDLVKNSMPEVLVLKLADFIDNAIVPDGVEEPRKRHYLDRKQIGLYSLFIEALPRLNDMISPEKQAEIKTLLEEGYSEAEERMNLAA